jgi:hypothetical protein
MDRLRNMNDTQLHGELRRLKRDVEDFRVRAGAVAATLESEDRNVLSDPLHQRLTSIHAFLRDRLADAEREARRREAARPAPRRGWSLHSLLARAGVRQGGLA